MLFELIGTVIKPLALDERFPELEESLLLLFLGHLELGLVYLDLSVELLVLASQIVLNALIGDCNFADGQLAILIFANVGETPHAFELVTQVRAFPALPWVFPLPILVDHLQELVLGGQAEGGWLIAALPEGEHSLLVPACDVEGDYASEDAAVDWSSEHCDLHLRD